MEVVDYFARAEEDKPQSKTSNSIRGNSNETKKTNTTNGNRSNSKTSTSVSVYE